MDLVHKLYKNQNASYLSRKFFQPLTYSFMGLVSKIALLRHHLNIIGSERLQLAIDKRPSNQPLITGRIIQPHERGSERNIRLRWGIGRLIAESKEDPLIIPIWHCGLDELNPSEVPDTSVTLSRIFGRPRQLTVAVGKPINTHDLRQKLKSKSSEYFASLEFRSQIHSLFTQIIQEQLYKLKDETELIHRKLTLI
ncbi:Tafazzin like [Schistosoma japonicum]|nr:Tafazzin like [Schistosoma japonicum]